MDNTLDIDNKDIINDFVNEARNLLRSVGSDIHEFSKECKGPEHRETLNNIFRFFHTMKGSASFLDFAHMGKVSHLAGSLIDFIRSDQIILRLPEHHDLIRETYNFLTDAINNIEKEYSDKAMEEKGKILSGKIKDEIPGTVEIPDIYLSEESGPHESSGKFDQNDYEAEEQKPNEESIGPEPDVMLNPELIEAFVQEADEMLQEMEENLLRWAKYPENMEEIANLFRRIHSLKGNCGFYGYVDLEKLSHHIESLLDAVKSGADLNSGKIVDTLLSLKDILTDTVTDISQGGKGKIPDLQRYLELINRLIPDTWGKEKEKIKEKMNFTPQGKVSRGVGSINLHEVEDGKKNAGMEDMDEDSKDKGVIVSTKSNNKIIKRQNIRVDLDKLDSLINLIGEMAIAENMIINNPDLEGLELESFSKATTQMNKIVRELQEMAMTIRMIPVAGLFRRMIRLVHDLSNKFGKKIDLKLIGEETEVDKTVIEIITDPMVHIIRNALDHGIESPEEREKAGKPEKGKLRLTANHEEGYIRITVSDDGKGLDTRKILQKAISKGLVEDDGSQISDREIYEFIFTPGFSTADQVTDVSGRGVGMDVVKKNLEKIKGRVDIRSVPGKGSTFTLRIPLTLAIIDGMIVRVGEALYVLPVLSIKESFVPKEESITVTPDGLEIVSLRDLLLPVIRLEEFYSKSNGNRKNLSEGIVVVLEYQGINISVFVDELVGQQQIVIKALSNYIDKVRGVSGCTILGSGEVCLIIDVTGFVESLDQQKFVQESSS